MKPANKNRRLGWLLLSIVLVFGAAQVPVAHAGLFGESDEEKAAREQAEQHEQNQDNSISVLQDRLHDLEESLRQLTGQNEMLSHRIDELNQKIDRQQKDFEYRLCALAAEQLGATPDQPSESTLPCNSTGSAPTNASPQGMPSASAPPQHLAPAPGVLGTLPSGAQLPPQGTSMPQSAPAGDRSQYDAAMNLLAKAQYDDALAAFRSYADTYPKDDLAPQALYWVGDISYVRKDYMNAARAFAENIKKYPTSARAPDSMLKLGQSLLAMDQKPEGCTTLGAIKSKYPSAPPAVLTQAQAERKSSCH